MASSTSQVHNKSSKSYQYDVFLSFSGEDTRRTFVDHLYDALQRHGIHTFKDDERLQKGKKIKDELLKSIEDSRFCVIVFSKSYASSSWCLDELVKIMERQKTTDQVAFPVFYDVEPFEVRKQSGSVGEALAKHTRKVVAGKTLTKTVVGKALAKHVNNKLGKWRKALKDAANLSGWDLRNTTDGHEAKVIKLIVERLSLELRPINLNVDEILVGMEHRMLDLQSSLQIGINDVRMIGIKGMGGAGKTTLARAIFDKLSPHFEAKSFIENVREVSKASLSGLLLLQRQALSDLIMDHGNYIGSVHDGKSVMKIRLSSKKVLLVLDDVDHISQLEALAGESNWFKSGSRIIITTRDEQVLIAHRVDLICDVDLLSDEEAICLFSRHAFGRHIPTIEFERQSLEVLRYAAGLPLTIKVLGSNRCGKDETEWIDTLERLKSIPLKETLKILQLSYESLEDDHKEIFLDVACLLKDWNKDNAIIMLESCGVHAISGLRVLQQKSLITIDYENYNRIRMHHHIEEMGKYIVRYLHPDDPSKHSRLWVQEEIEDVLANDLGTEATRCISLKITPEIVLGGLRNMKKLRCLIIDYRYYTNYSADCVKIDEVLQCFPNSLRYLYWCGYPHTCLPETFRANNLVALKIHNSKIEKLWEAGKVMKKLKTLVLQVTKLRTCDLGLLPNLERLQLTECSDLAEVCVPVGGHKSLVDLTMSNCKSLKSLSFIKQLESLEVLEIVKLEHREFPDIIPQHSNSGLLQLKILDSDFEEVSSSIGNFRKLVYLNLNGSKHLKSLPISFYSLQHLRTLTLQYSGIEESLEGLGRLECLEMLDLRHTNIKHLPNSICTLKNLKALLLQGCKFLEKFPEDLCQLESLEVLDLSWCKIKDIPSSICRSKHLKTLLLKGCDVLDKLPEYLGQLESLEELILKRCYNIREIPSSVCMLKLLKRLDLEFCHELKNLPEELGDLECLRELNVRWTNIRHLPHRISLMKYLVKKLMSGIIPYFNKPVRVGVYGSTTSH